jgi:hypothetical protein
MACRVTSNFSTHFFLAHNLRLIASPSVKEANVLIESRSTSYGGVFVDAVFRTSITCNKTLKTSLPPLATCHPTTREWRARNRAIVASIFTAESKDRATTEDEDFCTWTAVTSIYASIATIAASSSATMSAHSRERAVFSSAKR